MKKLIVVAGMFLFLLTGCHGSRMGGAIAQGINQSQGYGYCQETAQQRYYRQQQRNYQNQMLFYEAARYQQMLENNFRRIMK
jgi:hypothetical protein